MKARRWGSVWFIVAMMLLSSCGGPEAGTLGEDTLADTLADTVPVSALADATAAHSPVVTATVPSTRVAAPANLSPVATATVPSTQAAAPVELVVLHTNDNWGETEPCG